MLASLLEGTGIEVSSAGVYAVEGSGVDAGMAPELSRRGLDPTGFIAHQIDDIDVQQADLILTMSRRQRSFITEEWPAARKKILLMNAMGELEGALEAGSSASEEPARRRVFGRRARRLEASWEGAQVGSGEGPGVGSAQGGGRRLLVDAVHDLAKRSLPHVTDIADPYRKSPEHYAEAAESVEANARILARIIRSEIERSTRTHES